MEAPRKGAFFMAENSLSDLFEYNSFLLFTTSKIFILR